MSDAPIVLFETEQAWVDWLETKHVSAKEGVWLKIAKKDSGKESVSYQEALTAALRFGWIDGQKKTFDAEYWLQKFTPRRPGSVWSKINRDKAVELIDKGLMREAGLREVETAKQNGRWDAAYDSQSRATIPEDFQAALDANPKAKAFFETLNSVNRYAIIYRIGSVKKAETRQRKITEFVTMLEENKKIY